MRKLGLIFGIWCSFISFIYPSADILAAPGDRDSSFGGDGSVTLNLSPEGFSNCSFKFVAPTRDGKIMAAGSCYRYVDSAWYLLAARYNGDGTLDATFNGGGYLLASMESLNFHNRAIAGRRAIALQGDGKLIVVSTTGASFGPRGHFAVRQFNADGSVDAGFGTSRGMSAISFGSSADASAVALLEDGRILVAGAVKFPSDSDSERVRFGFALFHPNGAVDHSFGASDGTSFATYGDYEYADYSPVTDIAVTEGGKILFAGCVNRSQCVVARLESSGEEDSTFRAFRITQREPRNPAILPKSDGSVYLFTDAGIMRLKPDGALDWSWFFSFDSTSEGALAMQTSGKLLFGRFSFPIGRVPWKVGRVLPNGELDRSFGVDGYLADGVSEVHRQVYTIVALPDGKILIGGQDYIARVGGGVSEVGPSLARYDGSEVRLPVLEHPAIQKAIQPALPIKSKPVLPLWMKPKN